jgi:import inner membrane translocase subunit TIM21
MLLTFWVHGRGRDEPEPLGWAKGLYRSAEAGLRGLGEWIGMIRPGTETETESDRDGASLGLASASGGGREVVGSPRRDGEQAHAQAQAQGQGMLGRMFGGITGRPTKEVRRGLPPPGTYKVGEVRADYVKVSLSGLPRSATPCQSIFHPFIRALLSKPSSSNSALSFRLSQT